MAGVLGTSESVRLEPLFSRSEPASRLRGGDLSVGLRSAYGSDLSIPLRPDRPAIVTNFVSTLDGVISYNTPEAAGGGEISGHFESDRYVMGLLRALADVVLIGAGTVRADPTSAWTPSSIYPDQAREFDALRRRLGLRPHPITAVVTGSGALDLDHPGLADPDVAVVVITTDAGERTLRRRAVRAHVDIRGVGDQVAVADILRTLGRNGAELVLCEGGPHLLGQLLAAGAVDEMFLTLAPQIAGRSAGTARLGLVEGTAFAVGDAPWARLADLRRAGEHLFARYRLTETR